MAIMLHSETIQKMYLDYYCNYLTVEKFAEHNLLGVEHARQLLTIGRDIAYYGLENYQEGQL
jgi:hypothetical protein